MHTLLANCPILFPNAEAKQLRAYLIEDTPTTAFEGDDDESEFSCSVITKSTDFSLQADVLSFDHGLIVSKLLHMDLCTPQQQATAAANLAIDNTRGANRYGLHDQKSKYDDEPDVTQAVKKLRVRLSITTALRPEDLAILKKAEYSEIETNTHFVESIESGAEAYCVFVRTLNEGECKEDVEDEMDSVLNRLVDVLTDEVEPQWSEEFANNWKGRFYGDLLPHPSDCTLIQCYDLIHNMIDRVKKDTSLARPISVFLQPIDRTVDDAKCNEALLEEILEILNYLVGNVAKVQTWLQHDEIKMFPDLRQCLRQFNDCLVGYVRLFRDRLNSLIPDVRRGKEKEDAIQSLMDIVSEGLFNRDKLSQWMETKEKEMETMVIIANMMKQNSGAALIQSEKKLEEALFKLDVKTNLVLVLPPLKPDNDSYLNAMKKYIKSHRRIIHSKLEMSLLLDEDSNAFWQTDDKVREELLVMARRMLQKALAGADSVGFLMASMDLFQGKSHQQVLYNTPYRPTLVIYREGQFYKKDFRLPSAPQKVRFVDNRLEWDCDGLDDVTHFTVEMRQSDYANWTSFTTKTAATSWEMPSKHVHQLSKFGSYEFRIAALTLIGPSEFSANFKIEYQVDTPPIVAAAEVRPIIRHPSPVNRDRIALEIKKKSRKIGRKFNLDIYAVPLENMTTSNPTKLRRFVFGRPASQGRVQHKTILVMGATGSGKTTWINCMINYILDVDWKDDFRFVLVQDENSGASQASSQTSAVTAYEIHYADGFRVPYSLTIVDTPGYGDTQGLERDRAITENIGQFFRDQDGIQEVDAIGFVSPASLPRLTPTQMYIFDSVLSIFGKDIEDNIQLLLTFADGQPPPVLAAIKEANIPCPVNPNGSPLHHKFNNSGFFAANNSQSGFSQNFWLMGFDNFTSFFTRLSALKTQSLSLTREVLDERKRLEVTLEGLQPMINHGLAKMDQLHKTQQFIDNNKAQIDANVDVSFEVEVYVPKKVDISKTGQYLTNCQVCHTTCHFPCGIARDEDKKGCWAMDMVGNCRICANKCVWSVHVNQTFRWEYALEKQTSSSEALRQKYGHLQNKKMSAVDLTAALKRDLEDNQRNVLQLVNKAAGCIRRLEEIALRPSSSSTPEYINMMIKAEEQEKRTGYKERIRSLKNVLQLAQLKENIRQGNSFANELGPAQHIGAQGGASAGPERQGVRNFRPKSGDNTAEEEKFQNLFISDQ